MTSLQLSMFAPAPKRRSHHQRRPIPGSATEAAQELAVGERKAREQEAVILAFYRANPGRWCPSQVWSYITCRESFAKWPLTSVRARITTLAGKGDLRITDERRMGPFGRLEHTWERA